MGERILARRGCRRLECRVERRSRDRRLGYWKAVDEYAAEYRWRLLCRRGVEGSPSTGEAAANVSIENNTVRNHIFITCLVTQYYNKIIDVVHETFRVRNTRFLTGVVIFLRSLSLMTFPKGYPKPIPSYPSTASLNFLQSELLYAFGTAALLPSHHRMRMHIQARQQLVTEKTKLVHSQPWSLLNVMVIWIL